MTVRTITTSTLKTLKNSVIGNPAAKLALAQDTALIHSLVNCLTSYTDTQGSHDDIRIETAHVIASISYGSEVALVSLIRANALHAFLFALSNMKPHDPVQLKSALARGLRVLSTAIAEVVGPSQLGLRTWNPDLRSEAKVALSYLFEFDCLNIFIPLLADPSSQTNIAIAQLISTTVRSEAHRNAVIEWLPPAERPKEIKGRRGWEKKEMVNSSSSARQGGWVVRLLVNFLRKKDIKLQEAALGALSSLAMENTVVATTLTRVWPDAGKRDFDTPLNIVLNLTKSRSTDVQLTASLCAAHVLRANANHHPGSIDYSAALNVIHVVNRVLSSSPETPQNKIKTCYTLYHLVKDDKDLCREVYERGTLEKVVLLAKHITPLERTSEWEEDEPESTLALREATLTVIAAISLFDNNIRREVADDLHLVPTIQVSLSHKNIGIRHAACTCLRALSRAVSIIRTNIVDSKIGMELFAIFKKEDEDPRVTYAALNTICNLVNDFSPLRPKLLDQGLLPRLMQLLASDDINMRVGALWAMRNTLRASDPSTRQTGNDTSVLAPARHAVQRFQSWNSRTSHEYSAQPCRKRRRVDYVFESIDTETLANCITSGLESSNDDVTHHTACFLANIANGSREEQDFIFAHPHIIHAMHDCMTDAKSNTRCPLISCILSLVQSNIRRKHELTEAGITSTLRHMCDWTAGVSVSMSPGGRHQRIHMDDDKEAVKLARSVLDLLEHSNIGDLL
ncbi:armadillo-type protein [Suillus subaureus]|uniref:Armadillo-type protein n=1 Tax=Suillus subaureus TaxID=48587 RepID=A0A9P7EPZ5_9AGAM|nr:armadillo-type protein [Suillus subaureus]KAG1827372.1 armadillo-type protein [Suillus subaureus]